MKFFRQCQGKQAGQQGNAFVFHGNVGGGGAEPLLSLVFPGGTADGFLGNVQAGQGCIQRVRKAGRIVAFPAAHVQDLPGNFQLLRRFDQGVGNGGIEARLQKFPAGQHLLPGIAGVQGMLLLDREQVHITLPGHIKAVILGADIPLALTIQFVSADRAK